MEPDFIKRPEKYSPKKKHKSGSSKNRSGSHLEEALLVSNHNGHSLKSNGSPHKSSKKKLETSIIEANELSFDSVIGKGMFGTVWKGRCRGQEVAIKKLNVDRFDDSTVAEMIKEVQLMTHLHHPNIILFMGACVTPGNIAIVTEYMPRGDLHHVLHKEKTKIGFFQKCLMARDMAAGMMWLHESNPAIIHRDIKPSNMLVGQQYDVKLCDFGLSVYRYSDSLRDKEKAPGTPLWMAPEVMQGKDITEQCDVYAYGLVLWELFTGKEPFPGYRDITAFLEAICRYDERPPITRDMVSSGLLTKELCVLIKQCWDRDPTVRPVSRDILPQVYNILLLSQLPCPDAIEMWRNNWHEKQEVPFQTFASVLCRELNEPVLGYADIKLLCLEYLLCPNTHDTKTHQMVELDEKQKIVTLQRFALVLNWFGPLKSHNRLPFLDRLTCLMAQKWFHGDIDKASVETLLNQAKKNSYLVRFSYTDATKTPFTLSRLTVSQGISHLRLYSMPDSAGYFTYTSSAKKHDKQLTQLTEKGELMGLVKAIAKTYRLDHPLGGSHYSALFGHQESNACYESSPSNSQSFDGDGFDDEF